MRHLSHFWRFVYAVYPPLLRILERLKIHNTRQKFLLGKLCKNRSVVELECFLRRRGFEAVVLAWRDPAEVLSLRKIEKRIFQYHVRVFADGEIRTHFEYSPEGAPLNHILERGFVSRRDYFLKLLGGFLAGCEK